ncbi:MAG: DegT/DnrJ/EryC1/StrS family aminotransferase [Bdellovibrionota bacterium]
MSGSHIPDLPVDFSQIGYDSSVLELLSGAGKAIPLFKVFMHESVKEPLFRTLMSGYIGQGPRVDEFEKALAPWFGTPHVVSVNSGTSALHLALRLAGAEHGTEVISTAMTCTATNLPILERGARIVWADINPATGNIDPKAVEKKITKKTRAIMAVHCGGYPCELDELRAIAKKHGVKLIEDAAHAFGGTYKDKPIGTGSDFACFSFQAIKHFTTVDGGALTCGDPADFKRGKLLRWFGIDRDAPRKDFRCEADVEDFGYKFHMNDVTATIGLEQLKYSRAVVNRHQENGEFYRKNLSGLSGVQLLESKPDRKSAYWLFTLLANDRLDFMKAMGAAGITVSQVHARNDKHTMMRDFVTELPGVDAFVEKMVSIPVGWWVTDEQRQYIVDTIRKLRR